MAEADPLIGKRINNYTLVERLGKGAMGVVYKARHEMLDRDAAVKLLAPQFTNNPDFVARFLREARAAARLNHPNIVTVYDAGVEEDAFYLAMEYVDGRNLQQLLKAQGVFSEADVLGYGIAAASALAYAHQHDIIHRDIKPDNLMLSRAGVLKVADLGLAKAMDEENASLTMSGVVVGTPHYVSPEQIRGEKDVDGRADIYSLGATLFHLATGRPPYAGTSSGDVMSKHLSESIPLPKKFNPKLSEGFCQVFFKMMFKDRNDRYPSMGEVVAGLERCLQTCQQKGDSQVRVPEVAAPVDSSAGATLIAAVAPAPSSPLKETARLKLKKREPSTSAVVPPASLSQSAVRSIDLQPVEPPPLNRVRPAPKPARASGNAWYDGVCESCRGKNVWLHLPVWIYCLYVGVGQFRNPVDASLFLWINQWMHWTGHVLASPGDAMLRVSGGTIFQLAIPLLALISLVRHRRCFAAAIDLAWLSTNLVTIGVYLGDAKAMVLGKLVAGDAPKSVHDWAFLLTDLGTRSSCEKIGEIIRASGHAIMLLALVSGAVLLWLMFRLRKDGPAKERPKPGSSPVRQPI